MIEGNTNSYILDKEFNSIVKDTYYGNFSGNLLENNSKGNSIIMVSSVLGLGASIYLGMNPLLLSIIGGLIGLIITNIK